MFTIPNALMVAQSLFARGRPAALANRPERIVVCSTRKPIPAAHAWILGTALGTALAMTLMVTLLSGHSLLSAPSGTRIHPAPLTARYHPADPCPGGVPSC